MEQMDFSIEVSESAIKEFADYLYQRENARATVKKYMADIKKLFSFLADAKRINKKVLLQYKDWLVQNYAVNSVNSMLAALNQFLEFLNVGNLKVKRIKVQKQPFLQAQKEVTEKECRKLIATAMAEGKEQLALCMETIACTGIRISELKYFTVERIKRGKIEIYNKGKYRKIFPHNLRHLFTRSYYEDTKDLAGLADLLGHSSVNVTRIYISTTESVFQKRINRFIEQKNIRSTT